MVNKRIIAAICLVLIGSVIVAACGAATPKAEAVVGNAQIAVLNTGVPPAPSIEPQNSALDAKEQTQQRIVLKNANLRLTVADTNSTAARISQIAEQSGGWIINSNVSNVAGTSGSIMQQATISIRVPAQHFTDILTQIKAFAVSVDNEETTGQDVTQQYTDLDSQRVNLEAAEAQLRTFMEAAKGTQDVLTIYNELVKVRGQIETIKGQLNYFKEAAAYSSISLTLLPKASDRPADKPLEIAGWNPLNTVKSAVSVLLNLLQLLVDALIWVVTFGLPLFIVGGIGWFIYRRVNRYRKPKIVPPA